MSHLASPATDLIATESCSPGWSRKQTEPATRWQEEAARQLTPKKVAFTPPWWRRCPNLRRGVGWSVIAESSIDGLNGTKKEFQERPTVGEGFQTFAVLPPPHGDAHL